MWLLVETSLGGDCPGQVVRARSFQSRDAAVRRAVDEAEACGFLREQDVTREVLKRILEDRGWYEDCYRVTLLGPLEWS